MLAAGALSPGQLIIIVILVVLLFGGKRLRSFGSDLGEAIKGFKNSMSGDDKDKNKEEETKNLEQQNPQQPVKQTEKTEHKD
jgi:sec-independent protein translocase protein TatA